MNTLHFFEVQGEDEKQLEFGLNLLIIHRCAACLLYPYLAVVLKPAHV